MQQISTTWKRKLHYTFIWYSQAYQSQNSNLKKYERKQPKTSRWKTSLKSSNVDGQKQRPASVSVTVPAWDVRDELSELKGIILRGERILIPTSMPKEMLERIHQAHIGKEKSRRRARDVLHWPVIGSEIQENISRCSICQQHQKQNEMEPMIPS